MTVPAFYTSEPIPLEDQESDADYMVRICGTLAAVALSGVLAIAAIVAIFW